MAHIFVGAVKIRPHSRGEEDNQNAEDRAQRRKQGRREQSHLLAYSKAGHPRREEKYSGRCKVNDAEHNRGDDGGGLRLNPIRHCSAPFEQTKQAPRSGGFG